MKLKLCIECKHFSRIRGTPHSACNSPDASRDPVHGWSFADLERRGGKCGYQGVLFEPKPPRKKWFARIFGE